MYLEEVPDSWFDPKSLIGHAPSSNDVREQEEDNAEEADKVETDYDTDDDDAVSPPTSPAKGIRQGAGSDTEENAGAEDGADSLNDEEDEEHFHLNPRMSERRQSFMGV